MKHLNFFVWMSICLSGFSQDYLNLLDPKKGNWTQQPGNFKAIQITVTPSGAYANVDVDFEITTTSTGYAGYDDSLEAVLFFKLPKNAVIHDAYLWIFGQQVKAKLYERSKAKMIYETLVKRRTDPLIIYENANKNFEARIYPVVSSGTRHVRISYLIPFSFSRKGAELPFDLSMFSTGITESLKPKISLTIHSDNNFGVATILGQSIQSQSGFNSTYSINGTIQGIASVQNIYFQQLSKHEFLLKQPITAGEGFYQYMILPPTNPNLKRKCVYILDYQSNTNNGWSNNITYNALVNLLKQQILFNLTDSDEFNVVYTKNDNAYYLNSNWMLGDSSSVEMAFSNLQNVTNNNSAFFISLQKAISFLNANGKEGTIFMLSNASSQPGSLALQNQLINSLQSLADKPYPIHVVDYSEHINYYWNNGSYSYNNQYFFDNITTLTGGIFSSILSYGNNNIGAKLYTLNEAIIRAFKLIEPKYDYVNISNSNNGVAYQSYAVKPLAIMTVGDAYIEVGRYNGGGDFNISMSYGINGSHDLYTKTLTTENISDSLLPKFWASRYIDELILNDPGLVYKSLVVNTSMKYNVLCTQTAFLALEPDTIQTGNSNNNTTVALVEYEQIKSLPVNAYPNPFSLQLTVEISLDEFLQNKTYTLEMFNMLGKKVYTHSGITPSADRLQVDINKPGDNGIELEAGVYFIKVDIEGVNKTIKVIKM